MSGGAISRNGWIVATSIGAVEALKDQLGVCRWNYGLRLIHHKCVQSYYQTTHLFPHNSDSTLSSSSDGNMMMMSLEKKIEKREKASKKVLDLSCWGPSTVRF
ncbi:hypothetical protein CASFOL_014853 [Castilleja foliolosa]|uniref:Wound-responsive family protein n=1 Tax=Castilleja foliolosa TaxID=1961234 RepID=A0ABD3DC10_9LAMI